MGSKPKTPAPTAQDIEQQTRQRQESDTLTREKNLSLKAIKRQASGRTILSSRGDVGVKPGLGATPVRSQPTPEERGAGVVTAVGAPSPPPPKKQAPIPGRPTGGIMNRGGRTLTPRRT